jgi:hypothetical protein
VDQENLDDYKIGDRQDHPHMASQEYGIGGKPIVPDHRREWMTVLRGVASFIIGSGGGILMLVLGTENARQESAAWLLIVFGAVCLPWSYYSFRKLKAQRVSAENALAAYDMMLRNHR